MTRFITRRFVSFAALIAIALLSTQVRADNQTQAPGKDTGQTPGAMGGQMGSEHQWRQTFQQADTPDKLFLVYAAIGSQAEQQLSQLAQQKSQNEQVKQVAQQLLQDHQKMTQRLQQLAQQQGLQLPQSLPMFKQQEITVLQNLNGSQFDQQYLSAIKAGHAAAVSKCEDVAKIAQNQDVRQFATDGANSMQQHQQLINTAAVAVGLPSIGAEAIPAGGRIPGNNSNR